jgi:hypothetical protein
MWLNLVILFLVSVVAAILEAFVLKVDLKSYYGVGTTIGPWLFGVVPASVITSVPSGIYYYFKRKRMPRLYGVLYLSWIIFTTIGFIGNYVSTLNK